MEDAAKPTNDAEQRLEAVTNPSFEESPLGHAAKACVVKALEIGLELGNEMLAEIPHLGAMLNADPRLAARGNLEYNGQTILRGVEIPARFRLVETSEYAELLAALRADPIVGAVVGHQVATPMSSYTLTPQEVIQSLVWRVMTKTGFYTDMNVIADEFGRTMRAVVADVFEVRFLAPLVGLQLGGELPLKLSSDLEIDLLSDDEIEDVERVGFSIDPRLTGVNQIGRVPGIRRTLTLPRTVDDPLGTTRETQGRLWNFYESSEKVVEQVLFALRLFKLGRIVMPGGVLAARDLVTDGGVWWPRNLGPGRARPRGENYVLMGTENDAFIRFFADCGKSRKKSSRVETAVRRFSYAADRVRPDDELVDLMIAAESLFLDSTDGGELTHKLALRAALYLSDQPTAMTKRDVLRHMRRAYSARSNVVHAKTPRPPNRGGMPDDFPGFVQKTEDMMRLALHKAVRETAERGSFSVPWDELLFPDAATTDGSA